MKISSKVLISVFSLSILAVLTLPMMAGAQFGQDNMNALGTTAGLGSKSLPELFGSIIQVILSFLGIVAVLICIGGGFMWMTAGGDAAKVDKAKKMITNGIIGVVIVVASYAIATFLISQLTTIAG